MHPETTSQDDVKGFLLHHDVINRHMHLATPIPLIHTTATILLTEVTRMKQIQRATMLDMLRDDYPCNGDY